MRDRTLISRCSARIFLGAASWLVPALVSGQTPWAVTLTPSLDPLPVGFCAAIHLTVLDASGKDAPRNALGARVTIADFDVTVTGNGVVANRIDAYHWDSCACQSAKPASTATVTVSYPSRSLAANAQVPGVTLQRAATFTIAAAKGTSNPPACTAPPASPAPSASTMPQPLGVPAVPRTPPASAPAAPSPAPVASGSVAPAGTLPQPLGVPAVPRTPPASAPAPPVGVALPPPPVAVAPSPIATPPTPVAIGTAPPARARLPINPSGFTAVQVAPGQVRLSWQPVSGASFYGLFGPGLTQGGEKIVGATTFTATNVPAGSQQWAVASFIEPGNVSTLASEFPRVTLNVTPVPVNPSGLSAVQTGTGQVTLSWQPVNGASFYLLLGPGVTAGGEKVSGATTFTATNVPAGAREWAVASFYEPGNVSTAAANFPRVTLNVTAAPPPPTTPPAPPVTSGRYRVVATRFTVGRETIDNLLNQDGTGDEIYGGFSMFHVKRVNGDVLDQDLRRTKVHGQVIDGIDRVAAGSATPNGGLIAGNSHGSSTAPGGDQTFPFLVWDGTLTNNQDALVLLPSLWESDNDDENFDQWFLSEKNALPVFWWDADMRTALTTLGLNVVTTDTFATGFGFAGLLPLTSKDRPVGLTLQQSGFTLRRRAIVLTREILEAALTPAPAGTGESQADELRRMMLAWNSKFGLAGGFATAPDASVDEEIRQSQQAGELLEQPIRARPGESTIAVPLVDGPTLNLRGNYILYLRVERVP